MTQKEMECRIRNAERLLLVVAGALHQMFPNHPHLDVVRRASDELLCAADSMTGLFFSEMERATTEGSGDE